MSNTKSVRKTSIWSILSGCSLVCSLFTLYKGIDRTHFLWQCVGGRSYYFCTLESIWRRGYRFLGHSSSPW